MTILIDSRAGSKDLVDYPPLDTEGELCQLDSGDVALVGNGPDGPLMIGVELKSLSDLMSSIDTGRLQATQIPRMMEDFDEVYLLYYGIYHQGDNGELRVWKNVHGRERYINYKLGKRQIPYGYLESFLLTLSAMGVKIKHVDDMAQAANWIGVLSRWWGKEWAKHKGMRTLDNSRRVPMQPHMDENTRLMAKVASQLPCMGFERALSAARYFTSVGEMMSAGEEEWREVDKVGKVVARTIVEAVRGQGD